MSKIQETGEKIAKGVADGYKKIENGVKKIIALFKKKKKKDKK